MANASPQRLLGREVVNRRLCLAGLALLVVALAVGGAYYARDDIVGTLSIMFMVPAALLLVGIGVSGGR